MSVRTDKFTIGEWVNYPAYGVGIIRSIETLEVSEIKQAFYVVEFQNPRLLVRIPCGKAVSNGLRHMCQKGEIAKALEVLKQSSKKQPNMWNKRSAIFEQKLRSGNLVALAEVLRDLKQMDPDVACSFSERALFEDAIGRFSKELSVIEDIDLLKAEAKVTKLLKRSA